MPEMTPATDEDIREILSRNEAGVADVLAAYELSEQKYFDAINRSSLPPSTIYTTSTSSL